MIRRTLNIEVLAGRDADGAVAVSVLANGQLVCCRSGYEPWQLARDAVASMLTQRHILGGKPGTRGVMGKLKRARAAA